MVDVIQKISVKSVAGIVQLTTSAWFHNASTLAISVESMKNLISR